MGAARARAVRRLKLPDSDKATIRSEKLSDYLLSATHSVGRHKARFSGRFGFSPSAPGVLCESLLAHARLHEVALVAKSAFGTRYTIDGSLKSPDGRNPELRVIWFVEAGYDEPQFVTAYPLPKGKS